MFGQNKVVTPKNFEEALPNTLWVTSIFHTLQGEGPYSGTPCVFIRLAGCNLQCSFCDTYFDNGDVLTFDQIFEKIESSVKSFFVKHHLPYNSDYLREMLLVITGGEPLMQKNLVEFLEQAHRKNYQTQIESNGNFYLPLPGKTHLVVSPKINEKTKSYVKLNETLLETKVSSLKFVVSRTVEGYQDVPQWALEWKHCQKPESFTIDREIYVSPMNTYLEQPARITNGSLEKRSEEERISFWTPNLLDLKQNQENHEYAAFLALKYECKLSIQQHLYASLP